MYLDALAIGILAFFVLTGASAGSLATSLRFLSLIGAYALSLALAGPLAGVLGDRLAAPELFRVPLAGAVVFVLASLVLSGAARLAIRLERRWRGELERGALDRLGGALVGAMRGALIVLLVGVLGQWVEALRVTGQLEGLPDGGRSSLVQLTRGVVERGSRAALGEEGLGDRLTVRLLSNPAEVAAKVQALTHNPRIEALQRDRLFWSYVSAGAYDAALNQASFLGITYDSSMRSDLASLGMISPEAAADPSRFRSAAREVLAQVGPRLKRVREDPALQDLARDPDVRRALEDGDTLSLVRNRELQALVSRAMASDS
ncbi:MAG: CvpA family protein [Myxococcota bacterium]